MEFIIFTEIRKHFCRFCTIFIIAWNANFWERRSKIKVWPLSTENLILTWECKTIYISKWLQLQHRKRACRHQSCKQVTISSTDCGRHGAVLCCNPSPEAGLGPGLVSAKTVIRTFHWEAAPDPPLLCAGSVWIVYWASYLSLLTFQQTFWKYYTAQTLNKAAAIKLKLKPTTLNIMCGLFN